MIKPRTGTKARRVWDISDKISETFGRPATRAEVKIECDLRSIPKAIRNDQYSKWKKYHGIVGEVIIRSKAEQKALDLLPSSIRSTNYTSYDEGWESQLEGWKITDCPYDWESSDGVRWMKGYEESKE